MTISELLRTVGTHDQFDIMQRADAAHFPEHDFQSTNTSSYPHCRRCYVPLNSSESQWNAGRCEKRFPCGRYYGGQLTADDLAVLMPPKPVRQERTK